MGDDVSRPIPPRHKVATIRYELDYEMPGAMLAGEKLATCTKIGGEVWSINHSGRLIDSAVIAGVLAERNEESRPWWIY